jgi:hypothetical protein
MIVLVITVSASLSFHLTGCKQAGQGSEVRYTGYKGNYFGEAPPDTTPKIFAHDLLANSINTVFSPDGSEFFFVKDLDSNNTGDILWMVRIGNRWTHPQPAAFNSQYTDNDICISSDGKTVLFRSWRPVEGMPESESASLIWKSQKTGDTWDEPAPLVISGELLQAGYTCLAKNGNLYFPKRPGENELGNLFCSRFENGEYQPWKSLGNDPLNEYYEGDMCVAADESYVITSCWQRPDSLEGGRSDLYISFRKEDGSWTKLINMGKNINSPLIENCPTISPDGRYFFFVRYDGTNSDDFWVSTEIIDRLRPGNPDRNE